MAPLILLRSFDHVYHGGTRQFGNAPRAGRLADTANFVEFIFRDSEVDNSISGSQDRHDLTAVRQHLKVFFVKLKRGVSVIG
jgi:hypothetical protein